MIEEIDLLKYEKDLYKKNISLIAGVDEAGRGPLFGPVVAAAVILPKNYCLEGLNDSKVLSAKKRDIFFDVLNKDAITIGVSVVSPEVIDEINIYEASRLAMMNAINDLDTEPEFILTDAMPLHMENHLAIIKGDAKSLSIAAASVIAKVTRDRIMDEHDKLYPKYKFSNHKGYPTKEHLDIIKKSGLIEGYRKTYKPVKDIIEGKVNHEEILGKETIN